MKKTFIILACVFLWLDVAQAQPPVLSPPSGERDAKDDIPVAAPEKKEQTDAYRVVTEQPEFIGGKDALEAFINKTLLYPKYAQRQGIEGKVFVAFIVEKDGTLSNAELLKGIANCPACGDEAIRIIKAMPAWKAGKLHGEIVRTHFRLPIKFSLESAVPTERKEVAAKEEKFPDMKISETPSIPAIERPKETDDPNFVYNVVQEYPQFVGGNQAMQAYLTKNFKYPESAQKQGIEGNVFVIFVVRKDGTLTDISILKGINNGMGCNEEALRLVREMPKWTPGIQNGNAVNVSFRIPIKFKLKE